MLLQVGSPVPPRPVPSSAASTGPAGASFAQIISCLRCFSKTHGPRLPQERVSNFHQQPARRSPGECSPRARVCQELPRAAAGLGPPAPLRRGSAAERSRARPRGSARTARPGPACPPGLVRAPRPLPAGGCAVPTPPAAGQCPRSASTTAPLTGAGAAASRPAQFSGAEPLAPFPGTLRGAFLPLEPPCCAKRGLTAGWDKRGWHGIG